jgi:hypothetical protein
MPKGRFTKEEEKLIQEFSPQPTKGTEALYYGNAFIVSVLPICEASLGYVPVILHFLSLLLS